MTKAQYIKSAKSMKSKWRYVLIHAPNGGIGVHELYNRDGNLMWTEKPMNDIVSEAMDEIIKMLRDGIVFTEEELLK